MSHVGNLPDAGVTIMRRSKWYSVLILLALLIFAAGLGLTLYPYIHGALVDRIIVLEAESFLERVEADGAATGEDTLVIPTEPMESQPRLYQTLWEDMTAYNEKIYAESQNGLNGREAYQTPSFVLADYGLMDEKFGVIQIPKLDLEMPLFLGATKQHMADGAAILSQTSIPIGGANTNAVIAGHRGYRGASYFRYITELEIGDQVIITNLWESLSYEVAETKIIQPYEVEEILIQPGADMITLLTCHPYASGGKQRYVIYCERVTEAEGKEEYND